MQASRTGFIILGGLAMACAAPDAWGQTPPPEPAGHGALLQELNRETTDLYQQTSGCIVRVDLPRPPMMFDPFSANNPLAKWMTSMNPSVRQLFPDLAGANNPGPKMTPNVPVPNPGAGATTNNPKATGNANPPPVAPGAKPPATQPSLGPVVIRQGDKLFSVVVPPPDSVAPAPSLTTNTLGIVLDDRGNVMVPMFVDRDLGTSQPIAVVMADGRAVKATYVGSDHATRMTVIHLEHFDQRPAVVGKDAPADGSLVMLVTLDGTRNRLAVWGGATSASTANSNPSTVMTMDSIGPNGPSIVTTTSNTTADEAAVVNVNGEITGLTLRGRYLPLAPFGPIVQQIVDTGGFKHRAVLGVFAGPVDGDDPARAEVAALGTRPAVRVLHVGGGSPAEQAGLQVGDLILTIAGQPISVPEALAAIVGTRQGQTPVTFIRDGREMTVVASLEIAQ
jgi:hypothetical protein